jgi:hypothetical protein
MAAAQYNADNAFEITPSTATEGVTFSKPAIKIDSNRDISFFEDTGTTAKLVWKSADERLGIGTSSPTRQLSIYGTNDGYMSFNGGRVGNHEFVVGTDSVGFVIYDETLDTYRLVIDQDSGNVGIGTSSPATALEVNGTIGIGRTAGGYTFRETVGGGERASLKSNASNELLFNIGAASEAMRIDSIGNLRVGVGNTFEPTIQFTNSGRVAGNPGYSFNGDLDTGMFNPSTQGTIAFANNGSESMRIDSSGNVGIGTSSPATPLDVAGEALIQGRLQITSSAPEVLFSVPSGGLDSRIHNDGSGNFIFGTGTNSTTPTERMRIDSSGNLLVGKTYTAASIAGQELRAGGYTAFTRSGGNPLELNRLTSDGTIVNFSKDGTSVGSIGTDLSRLFIGSDDSMIFFDAGSTNAIWPWKSTATSDGDADNTIDIGDSNNRFKDLYLSGGAYLGGVASANKLDDYEEGTWTPALAGTTTAGTFSGNTYGRYTKIGNLVYATCRMTAVTLSGAAGGIKITGLPFASNVANDNYGATQSMQLFKINFTNTRLQTFYASGAVLLGLESISGAAWATWDVTNATDMYMNLTVVYDVA